MSLWELGILDWIQLHLQTDFGDRFFSLITHLGDAGIFWILLTVSLLLIPKTRWVGVAAAIALLMNVLLCNVLLKPLIARIRPYELNQTAALLIAKPSGSSFPSGHASASFAAASVFLFLRKKGCLALLLLAVLIAFSRLYLYVHFPSDVLFGALLGSACGIAAVRITAWIQKSVPRKDNK